MDVIEFILFILGFTLGFIVGLSLMRSYVRLFRWLLGI